MPTCRLYDRAGMTTATTGTGTVTLGSAISNAYFNFNGAGVPDGYIIRYVIDDGSDFEIGEGTYTAAGTTVSRDIVIRSNIAGVQGTSKLNLSGAATVRIDASRTDLVGAYMYGQQYSGMVNGTLVATVAANALTIAVKTLTGTNPSLIDPVIFIFRNSTLAGGDYQVYRVTAALSMVVTSTATLGHASARDQQLILYAIDNAGTVELAVATKLFDQSARRVSTTLMAVAVADPAVMYSTTARTNVAWYPIARCVSNQTTAGTWTAVPTQIDLAPFTLPTNACRIYLNADQTGVADSTLTKVAYDTVDFDPDSIADVATNRRIQPKVPGTYLVSQTFYATGTVATGNVGSARPAKNGTTTTLNAVGITSTSDVGIAVSDELQFNGTTDYVEGFGLLKVTSGTATFTGAARLNRLSIVRVGP